jgi:hypothetical protein
MADNPFLRPETKAHPLGVFMRWAYRGALIGLFPAFFVGNWLNAQVPLPVPFLGWKLIVCLAFAVHVGLIAVFWTWRAALWESQEE